MYWILTHTLLVWRMLLYIRLKNSFKVRSDCGHLNSHVGCDIKHVTVFRLFGSTIWKSRRQINYGKRKKFQQCTIRQSIHFYFILKKSCIQMHIILLVLITSGDSSSCNEKTKLCLSRDTNYFSGCADKSWMLSLTALLHDWTETSFLFDCPPNTQVAISTANDLMMHLISTPTNAHT